MSNIFTTVLRTMLYAAATITTYVIIGPYLTMEAITKRAANTGFLNIKWNENIKFQHKTKQSKSDELPDPSGPALSASAQNFNKIITKIWNWIKLYMWKQQSHGEKNSIPSNNYKFVYSFLFTTLIFYHFNLFRGFLIF